MILQVFSNHNNSMILGKQQKETTAEGVDMLQELFSSHTPYMLLNTKGKLWNKHSSGQKSMSKKNKNNKFFLKKSMRFFSSQFSVKNHYQNAPEGPQASC